MQIRRNTNLPVLKLILFTVGILLKIPASGQTINTIAGNGTAGYSGGGTPATSYELYRPSGVAYDPNTGYIYIADYGENRVRKYDPSTLTISDFAGTGTPGYSGDGGAATSATLYGPEAIAVDPSNGDVYFTEIVNNVVRKVSGGTISTVAGSNSLVSAIGTLGDYGDYGAATSSYIYQPHGIAVDSSHNVYIADTVNNRVREIVASTGHIVPFAGTGTAGSSGDGAAATSAELSAPMGIALDFSGNLYIADYGNAKIRKVTVSTGYISTVAGTGTPGNTGDGSAATSGEIYAFNVALNGGGDLYIGSGPVIRMVSVATGNLSTVAGNGTVGYVDGVAPTSGEIGGGPDGLAIDGSGNIFIADDNNSRVREIAGGACAIPIYNITPTDYVGGHEWDTFTVATVNATTLAATDGILIWGDSYSYYNNSWSIDSITDSTHFVVVAAPPLLSFSHGYGGCISVY